jgi:hypothetical protein
MEAAQLLASYGQLVGLADLVFDAHGCARLKFSDDAAVNLEVDPAGDCVHLYAVLGPLPAGPNERAYRELLEGNLFGTRTRGATLAIDAVQQEVVLCRRVGLGGADVAVFAATLDDFVIATREWQQLFSSGDLAAEVPSSPAMPVDWQLRG